LYNLSVVSTKVEMIDDDTVLCFFNLNQFYAWFMPPKYRESARSQLTFEELRHAQTSGNHSLWPPQLSATLILQEFPIAALRIRTPRDFNCDGVEWNEKVAEFCQLVWELNETQSKLSGRVDLTNLFNAAIAIPLDQIAIEIERPLTLASPLFATNLTILLEIMIFKGIETVSIAVVDNWRLFLPKRKFS